MSTTPTIKVPAAPHKNYHVAKLYSQFVSNVELLIEGNDSMTIDELLSSLSIKLNKEQKELLVLIQSNQVDYSKLNEHLTLRSYLVNDTLTVFDIILYVYLYDSIVKLTKKQQTSLVYLIRYVNHLKNKFKYFDDVKLNLQSVKFNYKNLILQEQQELAKAKLAKSNTTTSNTSNTTTTTTTNTNSNNNNNKGNNSDSELNPNSIELTVGKVISCEDHPEATKLYVEKISITADDSKVLTICSGLKGKIEKDLIRNQLVLLMTNLKPSKMVGIESEGMLLAATNEQDQVELITFNNVNDLQPGDRVIIDGYDVIPVDKQIKSDKLIKKILPFIMTNENGIVTWKGTNQWKVLGKEHVNPISNFKKVPVK